MKKKYLLLNLPSPPYMNVTRIWAGTYGTAGFRLRPRAGHTGVPKFPIIYLYAVSAMIEHKQKYEFIDAQLEDFSYKDTLVRIKESQPDFMIVQLSLPSLDADLKFLHKVKQELPGLKIFALGLVTETLSDYILENNSHIILVNGKYPYYDSILQIIKKEYDEGQTVSPKDVVHIDKIRLDAYETVNPVNYIKAHNIESYLPVLKGTGCTYKCYYCPYPCNQGTIKINKSINLLVKELKLLKSKYNIFYFFLRDLIFGYDPKYTLKLCKKLEPLNIKWVVESRIDLLNPELLDAMKKAGCIKINLGVETLTEKLLGHSKGKKITQEQILDVIKWGKERGIIMQAHMIIGLPGDTLKSIFNTLSLLTKANPDYINWNIVTPYPGTSLYSLAKEKGWIISDKFSKYTSYKSVMRTNDLSSLEMAFLKVFSYFYFKIKYLFRK